jgi:hypothetical protein
LNLLDAFVALVLLGLVPLAYGAFLLFRAPVPNIVMISPREVPADEVSRIEITGENLRQALRITVGTVPSPGFLILDSGRGEIIVPALPPGVYDLNISDGPQVIATVPNALTVVAPPPEVRAPDQPPARIIKGIASLRVRFVAEPEVLAVMKAGDVDTPWRELVLEADRAVLTGIGTDLEEKTGLVNQVNGSQRSFEVPVRVLEFTGTVRVPVIFAGAGWSYRERPVKVGALFIFDTTAGIMSGWIVEVKVGPRR